MALALPHSRFASACIPGWNGVWTGKLTRLSAIDGYLPATHPQEIGAARAPALPRDNRTTTPGPRSVPTRSPRMYLPWSGKDLIHFSQERYERIKIQRSTDRRDGAGSCRFELAHCVREGTPNPPTGMPSRFRSVRDRTASARVLHPEWSRPWHAAHARSSRRQ